MKDNSFSSYYKIRNATCNQGLINKDPTLMINEINDSALTGPFQKPNILGPDNSLSTTCH